MDAGDELLGFAVLMLFGMPWLFIISVAAVLVLLIIITRSRNSQTRIVVVISGLVCMYGLFFGDLHIGKLYVWKLCSGSELFRINETIRLPYTYWDEKGWPRFHRKDGVVKKLFHQC